MNVATPNDSIGVSVRYENKVQVFTPQELAGSLLAELRRTAEADTKATVRDVVVSVPCYWTARQRAALIEACSIANLNCLRLLNDTTATALQYGIYKSLTLPEDEEKALKVCFIDVGYSDTTVSVVRFMKGTAKKKMCFIFFVNFNIHYYSYFYIFIEKRSFGCSCYCFRFGAGRPRL